MDGRSGGRRGARAADVAGLRAERARRGRDGRARRRARLVALRAGTDPRRERPGAAAAHDRARRPAGGTARVAGRRTGRPRRSSCASSWTSDTCPCSKSPAVASSRGVAASSTCSRRRWPCRSGSSSSATRSTRSGPSTRQTSGRRAADERRVLLPASEFLLPAGGGGAIRERLGRAASQLAERLTADLARFEGEEGAAASATPQGPITRALRVGDAAEVWAPMLAPATGLDHVDPGTLLVLDEPGDLADAAEFLWRQADERRGDLVESGDLPKDWPSTYLPQRAWKSRLVASRTLELTWESEAPGAHGGAAAVSRAISSAGGSRCCPPGRAPASPRRSSGGRRTAPGSSSRPTRRRGSRRSSAKRGTRSGSWPRSVSAAARGHLADRALAQRRLRRRPGRPRVRHRSRAVRHGPRSPPQGDATRRAPRHPGAPDAGRPRRPHRPRHRALRADAPARRGRGGARLPAAVVRGRRRDLRAGRADPAGLALLGRRAPAALEARRHGVAADQAASPKGGLRSRGGAAGALRGPRRRAGPRLQRDTPWQSEMEASFPYEETVDQLRAAAEVKLDMEAGGRWTGWSSATSATARPRSHSARRSRRSRTASRSRCSCRRRYLRRSTTRRSAQRFAAFPMRGPAAVAVRVAEGAGGYDRGAGRRVGRHRDRDASAALEGCPVQGPGAGRRRRGAAVRGGGEGAAEAAPPRGGRADAVGDADPANIEPGAGRGPRPERHRDAAGGSAADPDPGRGGVGRARPRRDPARARSRRPGLLRPQPGRDDRGAGGAAPEDAAGRRGSSWGTARCPRARSRR